jgi:BioD-like phosphotransacetylase family protein
LATLTKYWDQKIGHPNEDLNAGMILTGDNLPRHYIIEELQKADIPMLHTPLHSQAAMQKIHSFTSKIRNDDDEKVREAIEVVERHIDFNSLDQLLQM